MEEEIPPVIATGTLGVVADQVVKAEIVGVMGVLLVALLELPPLPSQEIKSIDIISKKPHLIFLFITYLIFSLPIFALIY
jgi:hypothetical protein